ncbi:sodium-dependent bicarbonate transport family permease [Massilia sp. DJPM01]|uniref:sodium-dependent bicarbonate transport family permease n=1 Tax=Massilia sp. DJPM01 TaxID=3024404 RepID=UPI00259F4FA0|nr:sodium-dependent bicarbonate transport family permease [Massilia sp. DJPM01]MDM5176270.1 sodium-dependent bicarbonate transport family permease [Massilia sp. DJPM01]
MFDIVIAFFVLGLAAGLVKSDLKVPVAIYDTLAILLMLVLGLKGGMALHGILTMAMLPELLAVATPGLALPAACYPMLRRLVRLSADDASSVAAHYGSVSAGSFAVVVALAERSGLALAPQTTLYLVMLELPAIVLMLLWQRRMSGRDGGLHVLRDALTSRGVLLLGGGVLIGYLYGPAGLAPLKPVLIDGFKTMLSLYLLEMGLCAARSFASSPLRHWRLMVFAALAPFALAWSGIALALMLRLPEGSALVLAALAASASYIAAPAAIRSAIPHADLGLATLAALGITFPVNVLVGLPVYQRWVHHFY